MARKCHFTGKRTRFGKRVSRRGLPKYKGGIGLKTTGISRRTFKPNIQKVRAWVNGRTVRLKVSTKALKSGWITKPPIGPKNKKKQKE